MFSSKNHSPEELLEMVPNMRDSAGVINHEMAEKMHASLTQDDWKTLAVLYRPDPGEQDGFYISEVERNGRDTFLIHNPAKQVRHLTESSTLGLVLEDAKKPLNMLGLSMNSVGFGAVGSFAGMVAEDTFMLGEAASVACMVAGAATAGAAFLASVAAVDYISEKHSQSQANIDLKEGLDVSVSFG